MKNFLFILATIFALYNYSYCQNSYFNESWDRFLKDHMALNNYPKGIDKDGYLVYGFPVTKDSMDKAAEDGSIMNYEALINSKHACSILRFNYLIPSYRLHSDEYIASLHIGDYCFYITDGLVKVIDYGEYSSIQVDILDIQSLEFIPNLSPDLDYYMRLSNKEGEVVLNMDRHVSFHVLTDFSNAAKKILLESFSR